jgi:hypothetical protein
MQLEELLTKGYIHSSVSTWSEIVLFVNNNNGTLRMYTNLRNLNKVTVKKRHPLPRIDDLFFHIKGQIIFSKIELRSDYHQVRIIE